MYLKVPLVSSALPTTAARECIWTEIPSDCIMQAGNIALELNPIGAQITLVQPHRVARLGLLL